MSAAFQGKAFALTPKGCAHHTFLQPCRPQMSPFRQGRLLQRNQRRCAGVTVSSSEDTDVITTDIPEPEDARGAIAVSLSCAFPVTVLHISSLCRHICLIWLVWHVSQ